MASTDRIKFIYGTQAQYTALATTGYDASTVYFITDTKRIYKGDTLMAEANAEPNLVFVDAAPEFESSRTGVVYVHVTDAEILMYAKGSTEMQVIGGGTIKDGAISSMTMFGEEMMLKASEVTEMFAETDDTHLATVGAIAKAVKAELKDYAGGAFVGVTAERADADEVNPSAGTVLTFTTADGESTQSVRIADLFLTGAEYHSDTHILELTVAGSEDPVEVNLEDLIPEACSTADVQLSDKIVATVAVGNIKKGQEIDIQDLQTFLTSMLSSDSMPTVTQPSVSITGVEEIKAYEVGTVIDAIEFGGTFNKGGYSQTAKNNQVASGATPATWTFTCSGKDNVTKTSTATSQTATFEGLTVEDTTSVSVGVSCTYTAGDEVPLSYLGKTSVEGVETSTKRIAAGTKSATKGTITGYRNRYWTVRGASNLIADPAALTAADIKLFDKQGTSKPTTLTTSGMQQMVFAVLKSEASKLEIKGSNPPAPQTVLGPYEVQIGGVNDHAPVAYNVFYVNNGTAQSGSDTFTLTWTK